MSILYIYILSFISCHLSIFTWHFFLYIFLHHFLLYLFFYHFTFSSSGQALFHTIVSSCIFSYLSCITDKMTIDPVISIYVLCIMCIQCAIYIMRILCIVCLVRIMCFLCNHNIRCILCNMCFALENRLK